MITFSFKKITIELLSSFFLTINIKLLYFGRPFYFTKIEFFKKCFFVLKAYIKTSVMPSATTASGLWT